MLNRLFLIFFNQFQKIFVSNNLPSQKAQKKNKHDYFSYFCILISDMKDIFPTLENTVGFSSILHLFRIVLDPDIFLANTIIQLYVDSQCLKCEAKSIF